MSAPSYEAVGTEGTATTGNATPTLPTHAAGHWMLLFAEGSGATVFSGDPAPSGQTWDSLIPVCVHNGGVSTSFLGLWGRRATDGSQSNPPVPAVSNHAYANVVTFTNVHQVHPVQSVAAASGITGGTSQLNGFSSLADDCMAVFVVADASDTAGARFSSPTHPVLTLTERADGGTTDGGGGGGGVWTAPVASADTYTNADYADANSTAHVMATLVLAPVADIPITVAVEVDGSPHASGDGTVRLVDITQPAATYLVLDAATESDDFVTGLDGSGEADFVVPYTDHSYVAMYFDDSGGLAGCSEPIVYSGGFPTATISISTGSGGGSTGFGASQVYGGLGL